MKRAKIVISALRGGSGKTTLAIGIIAALKAKNLPVAPFKKGPDYIDAGWLAYAAGRSCYNLDTFIIPECQLINSFYTHTNPCDIAVIEGNRGLYDGIDIQGETSTAELAKLLAAPVILVLDCTKTTRTMAAILLGLLHFDPKVHIGGVILNHTAGHRHQQILKHSIEYHTGIQVLGALPKLKEEIFPERHMGLVPTPEHAWAMDAVSRARAIVDDYIDLDAVIRLAAYHDAIDEFPLPLPSSPEKPSFSSAARPIIGILRDAAFQFYYPENIEALQKAGAEIRLISPLTDQTLPEVDALYIGGGFPETHAQILADNTGFKAQVKALADLGLPIYAECGGLMYLGESLVLEGTVYPMAGVLPVVFGLSKRPQGHGYTIVSVEKENPFLDVGLEFKGHEFHYSKVMEWRGCDDDLAFSMKRGAGFVAGKDGVCYKNVLATYTHIHSLGLPVWASSLVAKAADFKNKRYSK
jgi:cobyrinic acid a,c-diamide synthase